MPTPDLKGPGLEPALQRGLGLQHLPLPNSGSAPAHPARPRLQAARHRPSCRRAVMGGGAEGRRPGLPLPSRRRKAPGSSCPGRPRQARGPAHTASPARLPARGHPTPPRRAAPRRRGGQQRETPLTHLRNTQTRPVPPTASRPIGDPYDTGDIEQPRPQTSLLGERGFLPRLRCHAPSPPRPAGGGVCGGAREMSGVRCSRARWC